MYVYIYITMYIYIYICMYIIINQPVGDCFDYPQSHVATRSPGGSRDSGHYVFDATSWVAAQGTPRPYRASFDYQEQNRISPKVYINPIELSHIPHNF